MSNIDIMSEIHWYVFAFRGIRCTVEAETFHFAS